MARDDLYLLAGGWEDACLQVLYSSSEGLLFALLARVGFVDSGSRLGGVGGTPRTD